MLAVEQGFKQQQEGVTSAEEETPIIAAVQHSDYKAIEENISQMAEAADSQGQGAQKAKLIGIMLNERDSMQSTPLHYVRPGDNNIAEPLIRNGADVNAVNILDENPLHSYAAGLTMMRGLTLVMDKVQDEVFEETGRKQKSPDLVAKAKQFFPENEKREIYGTLSLMDLLIRSGSDFKKNNKDGKTPIQKLCTEAVRVSEVQEQLKANISLPSFERAFQEYLNPSHARQSKESKSHGSSKKTGCIIL